MSFLDLRDSTYNPSAPKLRRSLSQADLKDLTFSLSSYTIYLILSFLPLPTISPDLHNYSLLSTATNKEIRDFLKLSTITMIHRKQHRISATADTAPLPLLDFTLTFPNLLSRAKLRILAVANDAVWLHSPNPSLPTPLPTTLSESRQASFTAIPNCEKHTRGTRALESSFFESSKLPPMPPLPSLASITTLVTSAGFLSRFEATPAHIKISSFVLMLMALQAAHHAYDQRTESAKEESTDPSEPPSVQTTDPPAPPRSTPPANQISLYAKWTALVCSETLRDLKRLRRSKSPHPRLRRMNQKRLLLLVSKDDAVGILRFLNGTGESADIDPTVFAREEEDYGALAPQSALSEDERYTLPTLDYTLPVHMRGGVNVDAFEDEPGIAGGDGEGGVNFEFNDEVEEDGEEAEEAEEGGEGDDASSGWGSEGSAEVNTTCALHLACQLGHVAAARVMCAGMHSAGVPLDYSPLDDGRDCTLTSRFDGGCANLNATDVNGWTATHFAVVAPRNGAEIISILAEAGARLCEEAHNGYTPFALSKKLGGGHGSEDVCETLKMFKADVSFTPEHTAGFFGANMQEAICGLVGIDINS